MNSTMYRLLLLLFLLPFNFVFSQNLNHDYNKALDCFFSEDYICAREYFDIFLEKRPSEFSSLDEHATYYHFISALKLYHPDTEFLFNNFLTSFELSNKKINAIFFMSQFFFEKKKYLKVVDLSLIHI